ncbi:MAG: DUF4838 domain-containing protein [Treponema sp.]|jgi:hypothetical protein|nr:DUF4838 domain-containing protein [Treponema sp.]
MRLLRFDVSKEWVIYIPKDMPVVKKYAEDLSHYIKLLRQKSGLSLKLPSIQEGNEPLSGHRFPRILLLNEGNGWEQTGFSWHIEKDRIEIYGESDRGLCNGVFDFLASLGFSWPEPNQEVLPPVNKAKPQEYSAKEPYGYHHDKGNTSRRRLFLERKHPSSVWKSLIVWAVRNQIDSLVVSLYGSPLFHGKMQQEIANHPLIRFGRKMAGYCHLREDVFSLTQQYALTIERGGWDLSLLVPRWYFLFNREMFRMDSGKRDSQYNFCPTAPDTLNLISREAAKLFRAHPETLVYHLWPDRGHERAWCSCPTCRAFTREEQGRIAVNTAADVLARINPKGIISLYEDSSEGGDIILRPNIFKISHLPGEMGAEADGWFSETRFNWAKSRKRP